MAAPNGNISSFLDDLEAYKVLYPEVKTGLGKNPEDDIIDWKIFGALESRRNWPVFVIEEDYSKLVNVDLKSSDVNMPFNNQLFVTTIDNCIVIIDAKQKDTDEGHKTEHNVYTKSKTTGRWYTLSCKDENGKWWMLNKIGMDAIKKVYATLILLESDVCTQQEFKIPSCVNQKRVNKGKSKLNDYTVIKLNHQYQGYTPHGANDEPSYRVRLHFRRGHWRKTTDGGKIWIKWCLVGDPALGFVEKHYQIT